MTTSLIINADDFGFSPGITDGIVTAHRHGILTSTTLMTNMPDAPRAIALAKENPALGVGIHLGLTQGRPITRNLRSLVDGRGDFCRGLPALLAKISTSSRARRETQLEWAAQIEFALAHNLIPTHLDSHKHIHHWPPLAKITLELSRSYNIGFIRCARETPIPGYQTTPAYTLLAHLAAKLYPQILAAGRRTTDWFFGLSATGNMSTKTWLTLLQHLPAGTGEVMVHPGNPVGLTPHDTRLLSQRTLEQETLADAVVKTRCADVAVKLVHYGNC
ncbi:MAG: ChbG/HpnK family deacetylase [Phycisphaerae bacterium]|nr:ChbG/HpnK family deacetylase [Phycisphaerae bacterium]